MSILPNIKVGKIQEEKNIDINKKYKDILWDVKENKIVIKDGKNIITNKVQQVKQWLLILIKTETEKYNVYKGTEFGMTNLYNLIGHQFITSPFIISELKRELIEKCSLNENIESVENIDITNNFNELKINMTVKIDNEEVESEVIF
ncbi:DUF2634 domain-containing protein [Fusobacterium sp. IOR10]|uniref:DUF2634 domain-containing protein n=1 Tax=Fusobacterium sp. IOR10 TaxID=2665157 RepID=UPI0013D8D284|nr:DUF2634 domain-containing protein [Fusobacterium sp. IOR10]